MTTVAYRAGVVAADTQATYGNMRLCSGKVQRLPCGGLVAAAGTASQCAKIARWVIAGLPEDAPPDFGDDDPEYECFYVTGAGKAYLLLSTLETLEIRNDYMAIGSGAGYAMGAMYCGKSPEEAVRVAAEFDPCTSAPVDVFTVERPKTKAKLATTGEKTRKPAVKSPRKAR